MSSFLHRLPFEVKVRLACAKGRRSKSHILRSGRRTARPENRMSYLEKLTDLFSQQYSHLRRFRSAVYGPLHSQVQVRSDAFIHTRLRARRWRLPETRFLQQEQRRGACLERLQHGSDGSAVRQDECERRPLGLGAVPQRRQQLAFICG